MVPMAVPVPPTPKAPQKPSPGEPLGPLLIVVGMLAAMWVTELVDLLPGVDLDRWGIQPRAWRGLLGIPLAPFLHANIPHLVANTVPFLVLGAIIALGDAARF